jgi:hypothetical protein
MWSLPIRFFPILFKFYQLQNECTRHVLTHKGKPSKVFILWATMFNIHKFYVVFVWISEKTVIISLYIINWLIFISETECVYCAVRIESLNKIQVKFCSQPVLSSQGASKTDGEQFSICRLKPAHDHQKGPKSRPTLSHNVTLTETQSPKCWTSSIHLRSHICVFAERHSYLLYMDTHLTFTCPVFRFTAAEWQTDITALRHSISFMVGI